MAMSRLSEREYPPMTISVERRDDAIIVQVKGSASLDACAELRDQLVALASEPISRVVLEMSGLDFISSLGLGAIVAAHLRSRRHDGEVRIVAPQETILELLEVTKLDKLFTVYPTVEAALAVP